MESRRTFHPIHTPLFACIKLFYLISCLSHKWLLMLKHFTFLLCLLMQQKGLSSFKKWARPTDSSRVGGSGPTTLASKPQAETRLTTANNSRRTWCESGNSVRGSFFCSSSADTHGWWFVPRLKQPYSGSTVCHQWAGLLLHYELWSTTAKWTEVDFYFRWTRMHFHHSDRCWTGRFQITSFLLALISHACGL